MSRIQIVSFDYAGGHKGRRIVRIPNDANLPVVTQRGTKCTFTGYDFTAEAVRRFDTRKISNIEPVKDVAVIDTKVLPKGLNYKKWPVHEFVEYFLLLLKAEDKLAYCDSDGVIVAVDKPKPPIATLTSRCNDSQDGYTFTNCRGGWLALTNETKPGRLLVDTATDRLENPTPDQFFNCLKKFLYG